MVYGDAANSTLARKNPSISKNPRVKKNPREKKDLRPKVFREGFKSMFFGRLSDREFFGGSQTECFSGGSQDRRLLGRVFREGFTLRVNLGGFTPTFFPKVFWRDRGFFHVVF